MKNVRTVTGLDIGSSKICAVQASMDEDGSLRVLGVHSVSAQGIRRGSIVDLDVAVGAVSEVFERLMDRTGVRAENICASASGQTIQSQRSNGMVRLSLRGREITRNDITKCVEAAQTIKLPFNRDLIHAVIQRFLIDDELEVSDPLGLFGSRLTAEVVAITANINHLQNIEKVIADAGYQVRDFVFSGLAGAAVLLDDDDRQNGVALIDCGAALTELSIFQKGSLRFADVCPVGVSDFEQSLDTDPAFRRAMTDIKGHIDTFRNENGGIREVVLAGGATLKDGIIENLEKSLELPARIEVAKRIVGNIENHEKVMAGIALGLAKYGFAMYAGRKEPAKTMLLRRMYAGIEDIFTRYF